ncbi:MAG: 3-deoxy-manno-octulosonate cytidylyltransferase [Ruminococcus flavefaciens]|nr:3-deoxy-manno-octulosonate cytidylyltransferase [Ruminococcus flavefaciens]
MEECIVAVIPARYQSSRFPGKPLARINGKPMIQWVYERVSDVQEISQVYVATDDERIMECVQNFKGNAIMTSSKHENGSDRIAECVETLKLNHNDIVLNIQGDEPLIQGTMIQELISTISGSDVYMGTLKERITNEDDIVNPNIVKIITDINDNAVYFSRHPIPYNRNELKSLVYYRHVGVYAYREFFLKKYTQLPKSFLEAAESLEQLRVLENGYTIKVKETGCSSVGVDTVEQLKLVEEMMRRQI